MAGSTRPLEGVRILDLTAAVGYDAVRRANPRTVYASISAFGDPTRASILA